MCRVSLMNMEGYNYIDKKVGGLKFFNHLEDSCGGHGNGIALLLKNGRLIIKKGLGLTNEKIVELINANSKEVKWILYHTRISSVGAISSSNCHPFKEGKLVLAMNGTVSGFSSLGKSLSITDTEAVTKVINKFNIEPYALTSQLGAVFMGLYDKKPFVTVDSTVRDLAIIEKGNALVFASEFPKALSKEVKYPKDFPFIWLEGNKLELCDNKYRWNRDGYYGDYYYFGRDDDWYSSYNKNSKGALK